MIHTIGTQVWKKISSIRELKRGDIVRPVSASHGHLKSFIVDACYGDRVTAVNTIDLTNPNEWEVLGPIEEPPKADFKIESDEVGKYHKTYLQCTQCMKEARVGDIIYHLGDNPCPKHG